MPHARIPLSVPEDRPEVYRAAAAEAGYTRLTEWIVAVLDAQLTQEQRDALEPYQGPGRRWPKNQKK
jgi:hypothetical protein